MTFETEKILETRLVKVEGRPNSPERPKEWTRWQHFKFFLFPHLKRSKELAEAYAEAKVEKEKSEAHKTTEEAAEIAARRDLEVERKRILDQEEIQEFNAAVDNIFSDDRLPEQAKALKFAKLIEKNQGVIAQLDKVKEVAQKLALTRGVNIEPVDDSEKYLPEDKLLTATEMRVLRLILDGKSNKKIANLLHRSVRSIEVHRSHIMRKLGVDNLVDLVKRASAMGLG